MAGHYGLDIIDLRTAFDAAIAADPRPGPAYRFWTPIRDIFLLHGQQKTYADLVLERGYRLTCDGVHLSATGAALVADVMAPYISRVLTIPVEVAGLE